MVKHGNGWCHQTWRRWRHVKIISINSIVIIVVVTTTIVRERGLKHRKYSLGNLAKLSNTCMMPERMRHSQHVVCSGFWMHGYISCKVQERVGKWGGSCQVLQRNVSRRKIVRKDVSNFFVYFTPVRLLRNKRIQQKLVRALTFHLLSLPNDKTPILNSSSATLLCIDVSKCHIVYPYFTYQTISLFQAFTRWQTAKYKQPSQKLTNVWVEKSLVNGRMVFSQEIGGHIDSIKQKELFALKLWGLFWSTNMAATTLCENDLDVLWEISTF